MTVKEYSCLYWFNSEECFKKWLIVLPSVYEEETSKIVNIIGEKKNAGLIYNNTDKILEVPVNTEIIEGLKDFAEFVIKKEGTTFDEVKKDLMMTLK